MELYAEKRNTRFAVIFPVIGCVMAFLFFAGATLPLRDGNKIDWRSGATGPTLTQTNPVVGFLFSGVAAPAWLVVMTVAGLTRAFTMRVTPEEIVRVSILGTWTPTSAWRLPIPTIVDASVTEYSTVLERLEREGVGTWAHVQRFTRGQDRGLTRAVVIDGEYVPLRVRREADDARGVMLVLDDGSSCFVGFKNPEAALAAIKEAMKT